MKTEDRNNRIRGFTLVELLVVIAIVAILVVVAIPRFFAYQDHSRKSVCEANRTMLVRQILYERALSSDYKEADAYDLLNNTDAHCPSGGAYTLNMNGASVEITCSKHKDTGGSGGGGSTENPTKTPEGELLTGFWDFIKAYDGRLNNTEIRQAFFKANGNEWPTITVGGKTYYVQPFYKTQSTNEKIDEKIWLFARSDNSSSDGWSANLVYDVIDGKWYGGTDYKGEYDPAKGADINRYMNINELHESVLNGTKKQGDKDVPIWAEITDVIESPGNWKP